MPRRRSCIRSLAFAAFLAGSCLCAPQIDAKNQQRVAPLHIQINKESSERAGIRIIKGSIKSNVQTTHKNTSKPSKTNSTKTTYIPKTNTQQPTVKKDEPSQDAEIQNAALSCAVERKAKLSENQIKNLADSFKAYLRAEKRDEGLIDIFQQVAQETGTDFELLLAKAMIESNLGANMKSPTSTARGVFQYIEQTWLSLLQRYGARIGYSQYANAIEINAENGQAVIIKSSPYSREELLAQRFNPYMATMIKAAQIKDEAAIIAAFQNQKTISPTDHYIAHMMGLGLAKEFFRLKEEESAIILAQSSNPHFREAVFLNPSFFYDTQHRGLTATQAYAQFKTRINQTYARIRDITAQYGRPITLIEDCAPPEKPQITTTSIDIKKPNILPAKGLSLAMGTDY